MHRALAVLAALITISLTACGPAGGSPGASGPMGAIGGTVTSGPTCPVERQPPDPACADRPVPGATLRITDPQGRAVATTTSDAAGHYREALAPGDYLVEPLAVQGLLGTPEARQVTVPDDGSTVEVDFAYDTGIR